MATKALLDENSNLLTPDQTGPASQPLPLCPAMKITRQLSWPSRFLGETTPENSPDPKGPKIGVSHPPYGDGHGLRCCQVYGGHSYPRGPWARPSAQSPPHALIENIDYTEAEDAGRGRRDAARI